MASAYEQIKDAIDEQAKAFEVFKKTNDERLEAVKDGNESKARELDEKLGRIEQDIKSFGGLKKDLEIELEAQRDRLEELEARAKSPGKTAVEKNRSEYKETFVDWIRDKGQSPDKERKLADLHRKALELKDVTIGSGPGGGVAVPEEISRQIEVMELKFSPVRRLVKVVQVGTSDYKELVNIRGHAAGWIGESGDRSTPTATSSLREVTPTHGELYAYPQASEWSLDDIFFNVERWLAEETAEQFALNEGSAVLTGNGTSKPTGMHNSAPTAVADFNSPPRAAAVYEFVPSIDTDPSPVVATLLPDALITLAYKLNSRYRANATWVMNSNTTAAVRKMKDTTGQYLWQMSLQAGEPDMLLGYRHETWEQLADVGTNALPVGFGDFRRGYVLVDRVGLRITRDNVTNVGFVRFYIRRREGGIVLNNDAIKWIKTTVA